MTAVALAAVVTLLAALVWVDRELPAGEATGVVVQVGVVEGQSVDGYLDSARHDMAVLTAPSAPAAGETWALVALREYAAPALLADLLAGAAVAQVYARVPLPDTRTPVTRIAAHQLPGDVTAGMLAAAVTRDQEEAEYLRLAAALTGDGHNEQRLREVYRTAAGTAAAEAQAYRTGCACVFAAVVRAVPPVLTGLATTPGVRVVDPAPEVSRLDRAEFRPPLPEESGSAPVRPSASAGPATDAPVAPATPAPIPSSIGAPVTSASPESSTGTSSLSVFPAERYLAVPSAADASAVRDGYGASSGASGGEPGR
ncbi:hypothetical protein [Actinoplanes sp. DH11]|uniref:hypothetical protein n=1 Tax=Actinoplanes sp. DH11 TaxID=2857011 RepID=UPI001E40B0F9|nr:hypothetical protein [Actinoplanes sp. DH11]